MSDTIEARLLENGLKLPGAPTPAGLYVPSVRVGQMLYLAGAICARDGQIEFVGKVGAEHTVESGAKAAQLCALNLLAMTKAALGSLEAVERVVTVSGFVNGVEGFADSPQVLNGASEVFVKAFGEAGRHARAAVTVAGLPRNSTVEVQATLAIKAGF